MKVGQESAENGNGGTFFRVECAGTGTIFAFLRVVNRSLGHRPN